MAPQKMLTIIILFPYSTFSKIMEKLVAIRLNTYLDLHNMIYPEQFGFRSGFSSTHSLISITEIIKKTIEEKKYGCEVTLFKSYLTDRKQFVSLSMELNLI